MPRAGNGRGIHGWSGGIYRSGGQSPMPQSSKHRVLPALLPAALRPRFPAHFWYMLVWCSGTDRQMPRRRLIALLAGLLLTWPLSADAQQQAKQGQSKPLIGFLHAQSAAQSNLDVAKFREGLNEQGYVENQNVIIDYRWGNNVPDTLLPLATDLVQRKAAVIVTAGGWIAGDGAWLACGRSQISFAGRGTQYCRSDPANPIPSALAST